MADVYKKGSVYRKVWRDQDCDGYTAVITDYPDDKHPDFKLGHECGPLFKTNDGRERWINSKIAGWHFAGDEWADHIQRQDAIVFAEIAADQPTEANK